MAPAKVNWTLEVLGRRDDGYHEVRSVMQTIDLCDEVRLEAAETLTLLTQSERAPPEDDLSMRAARALAEATGHQQGARISVCKSIPAAVGLGGG
ncbi:MAG: 4-(cytidine 5'-diphospho)-2-C-methyl-D-erythritol kinase, partial [Chloroflexi bacterium]|nr:4-(cytidine 5'-diphospho)-2-C-methyl-D-erythritol kinase [Chloroflexota bacterium]